MTSGPSRPHTCSLWEAGPAPGRTGVWIWPPQDRLAQAQGGRTAHGLPDKADPLSTTLAVGVSWSNGAHRARPDSPSASPTPTSLPQGQASRCPSLGQGSAGLEGPAVPSSCQQPGVTLARPPTATPTLPAPSATTLSL